jgi:hypothetical protein
MLGVAAKHSNLHESVIYEKQGERGRMFEIEEEPGLRRKSNTLPERCLVPEDS